MVRYCLCILILVLGNSGLYGQADNALMGELAPSIDMLVAADGTGDFASLQAAIHSVPDYHNKCTVIFIKSGTYREKVLVPASKRNLTLIGEDADSTMIVWDDYAGRIVDGITLNTFTSQTIRIDADDFRAINLTFENDARPGGTGSGQNVAISSYGARSVFLHCRFISWQDTYYTGSDDRQYLKDCFIEGAVDYIFGHTTTIFDSCQIHAVRDGGYITAASTQEDYQFGYVFFNCRLTAPPGISSVYLGRPWKTYARTVFYECIEYENIHPRGWLDWDGRKATCYYAEYQCSGPGSDTTERVDWSHQLTPEEASLYTRESIFSAGSSSTFQEDWDPGIDQDTLYGIVKKYTTRFMDPVNLDAEIAQLLMDGDTLPDWDPSRYEYSIEVASDSIEMPQLTATAKNPLASVTITYPETLPGFAYITVLANDRATHATYGIYFSVDGSYSDSRLDSIRIAGSLLEDFDPEIQEYDVVLPEGTSKYFGLTGYPHVPAATVLYNKPSSLPGMATIEVTAVDGSVSVYTLYISLATSISHPLDHILEPVFVNPVLDRIRFMLELDKASPVRITIMRLDGTVAAAQSWPDLHPGLHRLSLPQHLVPGSYIYKVSAGNRISSGKLVKIR